MENKTEEICEKCGRTKEDHPWSEGDLNTGEGVDGCSEFSYNCDSNNIIGAKGMSKIAKDINKKFTPKNHSPSQQVPVDTREVVHTKKTSDVGENPILDANNKTTKPLKEKEIIIPDGTKIKTLNCNVFYYKDVAFHMNNFEKEFSIRRNHSTSFIKKQIKKHFGEFK